MLFHTLDFALFFGLVLAAYHLAPTSFRKNLLLGASLFFYGYWNWRILGLLAVTVTANYICALQLEKTRKRIWLIVAICVNLGLLGFFKYYGFFAESLSLLLGRMNPGLPALNVLLPVGISFYTFELISYVVDVSRGLPAEKNFRDLLLFGTYFPKMMAGPIARAGHLIPLLKDPPKSTLSGIQSGSILAFSGLFKKLVIADNLALEVNRLVGNHGAPMSALDIGKHTISDAPTLILAATFFAVQIYADFSGYSDMARGMSRMLGIELVQNFNHPFRATTPAEFWRRWHITLGSFLRDYIYIPLGGNRSGMGMQMRNLLIVWTIGGLWHGASAGYVAWGFYCGLCLCVYVLLRPFLSGGGPIVRGAGVLATFLTFALGLMIFRLGSPLEVARLLSIWKAPEIHPLAFLFCLPVFVSHINGDNQSILEKLSPRAKWACLIAMFYVLIFLGRFSGDEFFYFQF
ncbi:MAG TPA: MBOAT family O-acyltransferase [Leptospiraceae bacterium]|nr:MBOAT family O-acyltransferase [Leptospiraceae bacterium]